MTKKAVVRSSINIALIKYWGKLSDSLNIPTNSSLSVTLTNDVVYSETTIETADFPNNTVEFVIVDKNDIIVTKKVPESFDFVMSFFRSVNEVTKAIDSGKFAFRIVSKNSMPTKAGMASSSSGLSALVLAMCRITDYFGENEEEMKSDILENIRKWTVEKNDSKLIKVLAISKLLRIVCGSSSRSLYPGLVYSTGPYFGPEDDDLTFVKHAVSPFEKHILAADEILQKHLKMEDLKDDSREVFEAMSMMHGGTWDPSVWLNAHSKSLALPILRLSGKENSQLSSFWERFKIVNLLFKEEEKSIGSRPAMRSTVRTSTLFPYRVSKIEQKIEEIVTTIAQNDTHKFLELLMKESNGFHAVVGDSYPPICFLNDQSRAAIQFVHNYNATAQKNVVGYTFDAGCNPFLFVLIEHVKPFLEEITARFDLKETQVYVSGVLPWVTN